MKQDLLCTVQQRCMGVCVSLSGYVFECECVSIFLFLTRSTVIYRCMYACTLIAVVIVSLFSCSEVVSVCLMAVIYFARNNQVKGFYFLLVPGVIFLKVVRVCVYAQAVRVSSSSVY